MAKKKKIFFPTIDGNVPMFINNVNDKLTTGGLGVKYGISVADLAKVVTFKTEIPKKLSDAAIATNTAQTINEQKDKQINDAKLFLNKMGRDMQDNAIFDAADLEALGFTVNTVPQDPNTAKPKVTGITVLPDKAIVDWLKASFQGVEVYRSKDGVAYTKQERDFKSPYEDTEPNAVPGVPEARFYKLRYLLDDKLVGLESDPVRVVTDIG
jgi:hypothetical protein